VAEDTPLPFDLPAVDRKKITVDFNGGNQSSNAGLLLLREAERKRGVCQRLADAVRDCVTQINTKVMKQLKQSRNDLFASLDRPALKGLPSERYQYAEWKRCTVAPDYRRSVIADSGKSAYSLSMILICLT